MSWIQVSATIDSAVADRSPYIDLFVDYGIESTIELNDSITGCLANVSGSLEQVQKLAYALRKMGALDVELSDLPEVNWEESWKQFFKIRRVGKRFVIRPSWEPYEAETNDLVIELDPGQAFGTGDHPTTRLCLELLETVPLEGKDVADVGCGSGILAVAAVLLKAGSVVAVDVDPIAVEVTKENAIRNNVSFPAFAGEGIASVATGVPLGLEEGKREWEQDEVPRATSFSLPNESVIDEPRFDVIVSNIISAILIRISPDAWAAIRPGGSWIVSGIIESNWPDVAIASARLGFELSDERREDGWVAARFTRP
jgi:ribosomal protein L11 methyltransferase